MFSLILSGDVSCVMCDVWCLMYDVWCLINGATQSLLLLEPSYLVVYTIWIMACTPSMPLLLTMLWCLTFHLISFLLFSFTDVYSLSTSSSTSSTSTPSFSFSSTTPPPPLHLQVMDGVPVYEARLRMGEVLAKKILKQYPDHDIGEHSTAVLYCRILYCAGLYSTALC